MISFTKMCSRILNIWVQPFLWTVSFFAWYQLYFTTFLGLILNFSWYLFLIFCVPFLLLWFLSICSLYKCIFTRAPLIPDKYAVPAKLLELLNKQDYKELCESNACLSSSSSETSIESNDRKAKKQKRHKTSKWEEFYRQLTAIAVKRELNVRTSSMTFGNTTIQCPTLCTRCMILKPLRVHHCQRCGRCILRMDHHCPALGKCVHMANHKYFLIFLLYATVLCLYAFLSMFPVLIYLFNGFFKDRLPFHTPPDIFTVPFTFAGAGCLQALIFPILLGWFQWSLWCDLFHNRTTLEAMEYEDDASSDSQHNMGSKRENVEIIFGTNKWLWFLPVKTTGFHI